MNLEDLGFDSWFQQQIGSVQHYQVARVIAVDKNSYMIKNGPGETRAEITGKLMFSAESPLDYPTVGDWVLAQFFDGDSLAIIHEILPRKTILKRKAAGKRVEFQLIASNIDSAFLMQSLDANFNPRRLERYLVMVVEGKISPIVLLSKSDLMSKSDIEERLVGLREIMPDLEIIPFSSQTGDGLDRIGQLMITRKTFCLLGSSGVGKTTLLNRLLGDEMLKTSAIREKDGRGRHTTTRRQLLFLDGGAMIIDTPGMRELGNLDIGQGLDEVFDEISVLSKQCRYHDCSHLHEGGCAILEAVNDGRISKERYQNFLKMTKEAKFLEMSYLEKRNKDKAFGKMIKSVMKHRKKGRP